MVSTVAPCCAFFVFQRLTRINLQNYIDFAEKSILTSITLRGSRAIGWIQKKRCYTRLHLGGGGGGRGYSTKLHIGRLLPEVQPLTLSLTIFDRKGTPFIYLPLKNSTLFIYLLKVSVKENEVSRRSIFCIGSNYNICHIKGNRLDYLNKVLAFWYLIFPFIFEASNSERPSLLQKLLSLRFILKITTLCCVLVTD